VSLLQRLLPYRFTGESLPCALCGGRERVVVATRDRELKHLRNVLCLHCGLVFLDPMPTSEEISAFYRDEYRERYHGAARPRPKALLRDERGAAWRAGLLAPHLSAGARVLDVGAGTGAFLAAATRSGWQAEGVEPHRGFAAFGREHYGANVHPCNFEDAPLTQGSYDLVTSSHVFEHLRTPQEACARVHALLKQGGLFHLLVPDISDPKRTPIARWHFGHVHGFTRETLHMLVLRAGFDLHPDSPTEGPHLLLRRLPAPAADWMRYPGHAERMQRFFTEHTMARHFFSATPYQRFVKRMRRFRGESKALARKP
jgi:SAM-dependent methyltransferase